MTATRDKLKEAHFFLKKVTRNYERSTFDYYLSAFISSARSVLWVMRSEYGDIDGGDKWYASQRPTSEEDVILRRINDVRVHSEKRAPLRTEHIVVVFFPKNEMTPESRKALKDKGIVNKQVLLFDTFPGDDYPTAIRGIVRSSYRTLPDFPSEDVLETCKQYYALLDKMVTECERLFPIPR